jgi:hypothetical protein
MKRILVVLMSVMATGLLAAPPATARAGGWAETVLDAPPARVEAGVTYTFGYWVLQHGSYPIRHGTDEPTGLRAIDENGAEVLFPGRRSATEGHYAAEVVFPHDGTWTIGTTLLQLMPDEDVATVTVPGEVVISPSNVIERAPHEWGPVRPSFPPTADDASIGAPMDHSTTTTQPEVAPRSNAVVDQPGDDLPWWVVLMAGAATLGLAGWLMIRHRRTNTG